MTFWLSVPLPPACAGRPDWISASADSWMPPAARLGLLAWLLLVAGLLSYLIRAGRPAAAGRPESKKRK